MAACHCREEGIESGRLIRGLLLVVQGEVHSGECARESKQDNGKVALLSGVGQKQRESRTLADAEYRRAYILIFP